MSFKKLYTIFFALVLSFLHLPLTQGAFYDPKSSGTSDHYTVSNPLVLLTGASKYDKKEDCLSTVKDEMEILYDLFHKKCDYEVKSTFFDDKGNVFPKHDKQDKKKMDGEWLYKEKFDLWLDDQYDYLRTNIQTKKYDALFFIFSGHGSCDSYGRDSIITSDYIGYPWGDIEKKFSFPSHSDLKNWAGKCPKFFFKLACRGSHNPVVVKMKGPNSVNLASKTYTFYATSQGTATGASNGVHLAGFISQFFTSAVKKKKHLSWIDNRLKEQMSKAKYRLDAPACYTGLVGDKVFFSTRRKPLDDKTKKEWWKAIEHNNTNKVKEILTRYNVNIDTTNDDGWTPLHIAARYNNAEVADKLIAANANVNATDDDGKTPLHIAAEYNSTEVTDKLIAANVHVNATDKNGQTPLHNAARYNKVAVAKKLIAAGANKDVKTSLFYGYTPLDTAKKHKSKAMIRYLQSL